jgi:uncharacterized membrane protein YoaK (UPF0700 family)
VTRRKQLLQKLVHFLTAFTILMKALIKLEHPHGYWPVITLFLLSAIYIVIITLLHERLHRHAARLDASVYAIECAIMIIIATLTFREGARYFPYFYIVSAIGFAIAFVMRLVRGGRALGA